MRQSNDWALSLQEGGGLEGVTVGSGQGSSAQTSRTQLQPTFSILQGALPDSGPLEVPLQPYLYPDATLSLSATFLTCYVPFPPSML